MNTRKQLLQQLRIAMVMNDCNGTQLADRLGVSRAHVSSVLRGKASFEKIDAILKELGFKLEISLVKIE